MKRNMFHFTKIGHPPFNTSIWSKWLSPLSPHHLESHNEALRLRCDSRYSTEKCETVVNSLGFCSLLPPNIRHHCKLFPHTSVFSLYPKPRRMSSHHTHFTLKPEPGLIQSPPFHITCTLTLLPLGQLWAWWCCWDLMGSSSCWRLSGDLRLACLPTWHYKNPAHSHSHSYSHIHICIHICIHMQTHSHIYIHIHLHTCMLTQTYTDSLTHTHTLTYSHTYTHSHTHMNTHRDMHTHVCTLIYT